MKFCTETHVGKVRQVNEDCVLALLLKDEHGLALVADGMGGYQAGEVASEMAVQTISEYIREHQENPSIEVLKKAIEKANSTIFELASRDGEKYGMGTTVVAAWVTGDKIYLAHVGDSRAYFIHDHEIQRLTIDHSFVSGLVQLGEITEEEARKHPKRNLITKALGIEHKVEPEIKTIQREKGVLLLCSDGITSAIEDGSMMREVLQADSSEEAAKKLICLANEAGGEDNSSVVLVDLRGEHR